MTHLYLVRHGENLANLTLEFSHRKVDYSLTPKGVLQAQQTADYLRDKAIHAVYSSPLKRAVETAEFIAQPIGLLVQIVEAFRELNVGDLEGQKPTAALWAQHNAVIDAWAAGQLETCFPNGENFVSLLGRFRNGLEEILPGNEDKNIVIVSHGGMLTFTLRDVCSPFDITILDSGMPNCAVTELEAYLVGGKVEAKLLTFAYKDHLSGDAADLVRGVFREGEDEETRFDAPISSEAGE